MVITRGTPIKRPIKITNNPKRTKRMEPRIIKLIPTAITDNPMIMTKIMTEIIANILENILVPLSHMFSHILKTLNTIFLKVLLIFSFIKNFHSLMPIVSLTGLN